MSDNEPEEVLVELRVKVPKDVKDMLESLTLMVGIDGDVYGDDEKLAMRNLLTEMAREKFELEFGEGSLERFYKMREPGFCAPDDPGDPPWTLG